MYCCVYKLVVTGFTTAFHAKSTIFPALGNLGSPVSLGFDAELKEMGWGRTKLAQGHVGAWRWAVVAQHGRGQRTREQREASAPAWVVGCDPPEEGGSGTAPAGAGDRGLRAAGLMPGPGHCWRGQPCCPGATRTAGQDWAGLEAVRNTAGLSQCCRGVFHGVDA